MVSGYILANVMKMIYWLFFLFFVLPLSSLFAASQEGLKIEGIVYDGKNQDNSYAVVDGNFIKKGDTYQGYTVTSVSSTSIQAVNEKTGKEMQFHITGGEPSSYLPPVTNGFLNPKKQTTEADGGKGTNASGQPQDQNNPLSQVIEQLRNMLGIKEGGGFKFPGSGGSEGKKGDSSNSYAKILNIVWEIKAIVELKNVYQMAAAHYMTENTPPSMEDLVKAKLISDGFSDGKSGPYRFYVQSSAQQFEVHADPIDASSGLRYFCLSEDSGTVRIEQGKPANPKSPALDPSNMLPWMQRK